MSESVLRKAVVSALQRLAANRVYTIRRGLAKGLKCRGGLGFVPQVGLPPENEAFLQGLELSGMTVYDIGGHVGVFTLFFAKRVGLTGRVLTFEPNPRSYECIVENVRLNGFTNVEVYPIALGAQAGRATLVFLADQSARGSLVDEIQEQLLHEKHVGKIEVIVDSVDHQISLRLPEPDFVKIDVEGFELEVLVGMAETIARRRPELHIEIHGLKRARSVIDYLWHAGYRIDHVESGLRIDDQSRIAVAHYGHLYCRSLDGT